MYKHASAFTLLEVLLVVAIIGILATLSVPSFTRAMERARVRDAQAVLSAIYNAERIFRLDRNTHGSLADLINNRYLTDPDPGDMNRAWNFTVDTISATTFRAVATRTGGGAPYNGSTVFLDQAFTGAPRYGVPPRVYGGTHQLHD